MRSPPVGLVAVILLQLGSLQGGAWAQAQTGGSRATSGQPLTATSGFWTPERLDGAQPMPLPEVPWSVRRDPKAADPAVARPPAARPGVRSIKPSSAPRFVGAIEAQTLYQPGQDAAAPRSRAARVPRARTSSGALHTTGRVFPPSLAERFPYRASGKLFFFDPVVGAEFECSGSVIERRLVLTAGHCVFDPVAGVFFEEFLFVPAFDRGRAPLGSWAATRAWTTDAWIEGRNAGLGALPSEADFGILEIRDQRIDGAPRRIGDVTGAFGFAVDVVWTHATLLGYPGNLDRGLRMQQTGAQTFDVDDSNGILFGTSMLEGSSGGPIVQDFGVPGAGNPVTERNLMVGVTSYGLVEDFEITGTSRIGNGFIDLFDAACARHPRNCDTTPAAAIAGLQ